MTRSRLFESALRDIEVPFKKAKLFVLRLADHLITIKTAHADKRIMHTFYAEQRFSIIENDDVLGEI